MPYYAQIDEEGICFAVTQTSGEFDQPDMIPIDSLDESRLGMKRVEETWEDVPIVPPGPEPPPGPSRLDQLEQVIDTLLTGGETP